MGRSAIAVEQRGTIYRGRNFHKLRRTLAPLCRSSG
jgi:hypothetical protein